MTSRLNPYISFDGSAKEAMEFYRGVFGGELALTTYGEGNMAESDADAGRIMHGQLEAPNGMTLMGADSPPGQPAASGSAITISLSGEDEGELTGYWNGLLDGGTVTMPLEKAPWGDQFGMLTDRFGVGWMVNIAGTPPQP
ncbi:MAG TPA: VOC family protein [Candidatus Limnocylindria bacterium]|nr:VOC family protein [Candidatus Limnocylindria bacterium]